MSAVRGVSGAWRVIPNCSSVTEGFSMPFMSLRIYRERERETSVAPAADCSDEEGPVSAASWSVHHRKVQ